MRKVEIDLTRHHPYLERHAQRYFARKAIAPSLAQDSLERAASYTGLYEYGDDWTPEIEAETIRILTQFSNR